MTLFVGIVSFVVILAVLILAHEIGHFTFAKLMGVRVEEFGLGFPPRLKGWRRDGTLYSLNAIPVGGFVKMMGENGEDDDPASFAAHAPWQRLVILAAGPSMNLLLAVAVFFFAFIAGAPRGLTIVTRVQPHSPAARAGLQAGDRIVALDGKRVQYLDDLRLATSKHLGQWVTLRVVRGSHVFTTSLVPRRQPPPNQGAIGIELDRSVTVAYGPLDALGTSVQEIGAMVASVPQVLATISQHGGRGVEGPIGIAHITTDVVSAEPRQGPGSLLTLVAFLSANLGVLNLLPVPALDGGRIVFVLLSWVRRRNLDPEIEGLIHMVGMAVLLLLIALISYQDLIRWVSGGSF